jgi:hypothetical protein
MRLGEIRRVMNREAAFTPPDAAPETAEPSAPTQALVPAAPAADLAEAPNVYRQVPFLAQLLATKEQHPQTRERRRAEPAEVIAAYRAVAAVVGRAS